MNDIYKTACFGETIEMRADFSQANSQIFFREGGGDWQQTGGRQVGDYGHDSAAAMREYLLDTVATTTMSTRTK